MNQFEAHKLIPADDLHWNEEEQKRVLLSDEEIQKIVETCVECGMAGELDDIMIVVKWAEHVKSGNILLNGILGGRLGVFATEGMYEPSIFPINEIEDIVDGL